MSNNDFNIEGLDELQNNLKQLASKGVKELNKELNRINNPEAAKKDSAVPDECPYCGAKLNKDSEATVIKCAYCGSQFDNSNARTIVDSVFDFVEKQQEIGIKEREARLNEARIKAEIKLKKRKKHRFFKFILLLIVCYAILYYYYNIMGGVLFYNF